MSTKIQSVDPGSPAARAGVRPGETLLEIGGHRVVDVLDYKYHGYDARLTLTLKAEDGAVRTVKLSKEEGEDPGYQELLGQVDTVIMGRTTYEQVVKELSPDRWPYDGLDCYVVTSQFLEDTEKVTFWPGDIVELVYLLKQQPGKSIWLLGGARLLKNFMEQELVDQYWISTIPVILGQGIRLFQPGDYHQRLIYSKSSVHDGIITSIYYNRA